MDLIGKVTRKRHTAEFEAGVALEAIQGEQPLAEIGAKHPRRCSCSATRTIKVAMIFRSAAFCASNVPMISFGKASKPGAARSPEPSCVSDDGKDMKTLTHAETL